MTHDVIIVGAGPAGSTAAIELARQGRSVALVEKDEFPRRKVCGEYMSATNIPVLQRLGVAEAWRDRAGPEIRKVALFAGQRIVSAPMPGRDGFGRALGRDVHDTLLRDAAGREGVELYQPCRAVALCRVRGRHELTIDTGSGGSMTLSAPVVIAAHGSWERNTLPTGLQKKAPAPTGCWASRRISAAPRLPGTRCHCLPFRGDMAASCGPMPDGCPCHAASGARRLPR
ncbi:FAD-dependent oxidoreductase [Roseibium salinum]|nr:FAD-dependent oxidoreductase [Roseibium salinum]